MADARLIQLNPSNSIGSASWISVGIKQNGNTNRLSLSFATAFSYCYRVERAARRRARTRGSPSRTSV